MERKVVCYNKIPGIPRGQCFFRAVQSNVESLGTRIEFLKSDIELMGENTYKDRGTWDAGGGVLPSIRQSFFIHGGVLSIGGAKTKSRHLCRVYTYGAV